MNAYKALLKREFWEHRGALLVTPVAIAAALAGLMIIAALFNNSVQINDMNVTFSDVAPRAMEHLDMMSDEKKSQTLQVFLHSPASIFGFVLMFISLFYALGCLYDERKDRSILFWKSLPISDTATVLSKFVMIALVAPLFYFVVITAFQLFLLLYATVGAWIAGSSGAAIWTSTNLFAVVFETFIALLIASIWMAPVWAYGMLASSWAKKVPFLWAGLPILMLIIAEGIISNTSHLSEIVGKHIASGVTIQNSIIDRFSGGDLFDENALKGVGDVFTSSNFWIGLVVSAILLTGAALTRRYRDES